MERLVKKKCEWCGEDFEYMYNGHGVYRKFCSDECIKNHNARKDGVGTFTNSEYLKGDKNKLTVLMKKLDEDGIDYSDYKKEKEKTLFAKVDTNL